MHVTCVTLWYNHVTFVAFWYSQFWVHVWTGRDCCCNVSTTTSSFEIKQLTTAFLLYPTLIVSLYIFG